MKMLTCLLLSAAAGLAGDVPITRLAGVSFKVANLDTARQFYTGTLGLEEAFQRSDASGRVASVWFKVNDDQYLEFSGGAQQEFELEHVWMLTPNLKQLAALLQKQGVNPGKMEKSAEGASYFAVQDPQKTEIRFVQYTPESRQALHRGKALGPRRVADHLQHVGLPEDDEAAAMAFYRDKLGFREFLRGGPKPGDVRWINMAMPATPGDIAELMVMASQPAQGRRHICFEVSDIQRAYKELLARGLPANMKPFLGQNDRWLFFIRDPNGVRIEFMGERGKR